MYIRGGAHGRAPYRARFSRRHRLADLLADTSSNGRYSSVRSARSPPIGMRCARALLRAAHPRFNAMRAVRSQRSGSSRSERGALDRYLKLVWRRSSASSGSRVAALSKTRPAPTTDNRVLGARSPRRCATRDRRLSAAHVLIRTETSRVPDGARRTMLRENACSRRSRENAMGGPTPRPDAIIGGASGYRRLCVRTKAYCRRFTVSPDTERANVIAARVADAACRDQRAGSLPTHPPTSGDARLPRGMLNGSPLARLRAS